MATFPLGACLGQKNVKDIKETQTMDGRMLELWEFEFRKVSVVENNLESWKILSPLTRETVANSNEIGCVVDGDLDHQLDMSEYRIK